MQGNPWEEREYVPRIRKVLPMVKFIDNKDIEYKDDREQDEANILLEILPKLGFWQFEKSGRKKQMILVYWIKCTSHLKDQIGLEMG